MRGGKQQPQQLGLAAGIRLVQHALQVCANGVFTDEESFRGLFDRDTAHEEHGQRAFGTSESEEPTQH